MKNKLSFSTLKINKDTLTGETEMNDDKETWTKTYMYKKQWIKIIL